MKQDPTKTGTVVWSDPDQNKTVHVRPKAKKQTPKGGITDNAKTNLREQVTKS